MDIPDYLLQETAEDIEIKAKDICYKFEDFQVDEGLSELDRCWTYLSGDQSTQWCAALQSLKDIIFEGELDQFRKLMQYVPRLLESPEDEHTDIIASLLEDVVVVYAQSEDDIIPAIVPIACRQLEQECKFDYQRLHRWVCCLQTICDYCSDALLESSILPIVSKYQIDDQHLHLRCISCLIYGRILSKIAKQKRQDVIGYLLKQCQDTDSKVRYNATQQLASAISNCSDQEQSAILYSELNELLYDEEQFVRKEAYSQVWTLIESLDKKECQTRLDHIVNQVLVQHLDIDIDILQQISDRFGLIFDYVLVQGSTNAAQCMSCYRYFSTHPDLNIKLGCVINLNSALKFAKEHNFTNQVIKILENLAEDDEAKVRLNIASRITAIVQHSTGEQEVTKLFGCIERLLQDDQPEIALAACNSLENINNISISIITQQKEQVMDSMLISLHKALLSWGSDWRLQTSLLRQISTIQEHVQHNSTCQDILDDTISILQQGSSAVIQQCADTVVRLFRKLSSEQKRTQIYTKLILEFAWSPKYQCRIAFCSIIYYILQMFSFQFFKTFFLRFCLDLLSDSVHTVRISACQLLPYMKVSVSLPEDVDMLERLNSSLQQIAIDMPDDLVGLVKQVNTKYRKTNVRMAGEYYCKPGGRHPPGSFQNQNELIIHEKSLIITQEQVDRLNEMHQHRIRAAHTYDKVAAQPSTQQQKRHGKRPGGESSGAIQTYGSKYDLKPGEQYIQSSQGRIMTDLSYRKRSSESNIARLHNHAAADSKATVNKLTKQLYGVKTTNRK